MPAHLDSRRLSFFKKIKKVLYKSEAAVYNRREFVLFRVGTGVDLK